MLKRGAGSIRAKKEGKCVHIWMVKVVRLCHVRVSSIAK